MVLISLMMRKNPVKNSLFFLLGFTLVLIAPGIAGFYLLRLGGSGGKGSIDGYFDIALGALCLLAIPLSVRNRKKKDRPAKGAVKAARSLSLGMVTMPVNSSKVILFFSGVHLISSAKLEPSETIPAMALLTVVTLLTLLIPIIIYVVFPKTADRVLSSLNV
jgi:cytochrome c biogenesis protein CcdA